MVKDEIGLMISPPADRTLHATPNGEFTYTTMVVENTGNSIISLDWSNSLPPDGWEVGFAAPPTVLGPRETSDLIVGVKAPVNELTSTTFDVGIYATINNGFDTLQVSESYPVEVLSRAFCSIDYDEDSRPLLGIDRDGNSMQTITIRNTGNLPLDSNLTATIPKTGMYHSQRIQFLI